VLSVEYLGSGPMKYNNRGYWRDIHKEYKGVLRAVGHPTLSGHLNQLKYGSEARTIFSKSSS
jgi:hypothetical protein